MKIQAEARLDSFKGQPAILLRTQDGAQAALSLLGGTLIAWQPAGGASWIYLSPQAKFETGTSIRGGAPVIFPQFSNKGPLPRHGWVRNRLWEPGVLRAQGEYALASVQYKNGEEDRSIWPYAFELELTASIEGGRLDLELAVTNVDKQAFTFATALHTYFALKELEHASLSGLQGYQYLNQLAGDARVRENNETLMFEEEVDRIYLNTVKPLVLQDGNRSLLISQKGFLDTVVWNPWEEGAKGMPDMPNQDFRHMLCIEAATIAKPIELAPGATWVGQQTLSVL